MMKQKQVPASGNGKPQTADEMAGNKLAGDMAERVNAAIKAADQAVAPQQKPKAQRCGLFAISAASLNAHVVIGQGADMQKQLNTAEFGPNADTAQLTGNKEAKALANKAANLLSPAEEDARLLAERNDVLDAAIERFQEGRAWRNGYIAVNLRGEIVTSNDMDITPASAEAMRQDGAGFCAIGGLGAEYGPHSHKSIRAAINAVADAIGAFNDDRPHTVLNYGFGASASKVWKWNDKQSGGEVVIDKFRQAKSQPLRRD